MKKQSINIIEAAMKYRQVTLVLIGLLILFGVYSC